MDGRLGDVQPMSDLSVLDPLVMKFGDLFPEITHEQMFAFDPDGTRSSLRYRDRGRRAKTDTQ